jgi:retinol-binding protein 3
MRTIQSIVVLLYSLASSTLLVAQQTQKKDIELSSAERNNIIQHVVQSLKQYYVSNEIAIAIGNDIERRNKLGQYSKVNSGAEFSDTLTRHLREISKDEHLGLVFSADPVSPGQSKEPTGEERERYRKFAAAQNYGFEKLERLPGNIGFMELNGFVRPEWGAETAISALTFLAHTDALIIDLRYNGGGEPGLIQLICSYFFEKPTHLNSIFWREGMKTEQLWTLPYVPGKKFLNKPIYILTSKNTFSAPEDLAYSLQALKRATIVGNKTRGGANPGRTFPINAHFGIYVPVGKAINPITGKNWEGGIIPDVEIDSKEALKKAHKEALQKLMEQAASPQKKQQIRDILKEIE